MGVWSRWLISLSLASGLAASSALAWGPDGHRMIGELAVKALPAALPAFLHAADAATEAGYLAPEPDRERGAGETFDSEHSPAHFLDVSDDLTVLGGPALKSLPTTREQYDTELRAAGSDQYKAGYLPYAIVDGFQLLTKDFAYWRVDAAGEKLAKSAKARAWYAKDRIEREKIALHDLGVWSHFVGDGSMPLHASVHYNGWGDFPNPEGFTQEHVHVPWENQYVHKNIADADVEAAMPAARDCACSISARVADYLTAAQADVVPFYRLEKARAFAKPTAAGKAFTAKRLALGAAELRDMIVAAWQESEKQSVGYPPVAVSDVEAGKADPYAELAY
ncbi:MAG: S1/P1 Nuclease [Alphaproteobacteria bacterium]|nr:S1/P1 Nuclease [Alphaproteobacteria bacterium]